MIGVVEDAELTGGDAVDGGVGVDDESVGSGLLQGSGEVLGGMANLEGDREPGSLGVGATGIQGIREACTPLRGLGGEPVHVMDGKIRLIGRCRIVAMRDIKDVVGDILFDNKPRTSGEAHAFALANGMEPESTMLTDATTGLQLDDITRLFAEVTTDIVVVVDLP